MYKQHGLFHFSPSDLTRYLESPFASWMDRFSIEHPDQAPEKDPDSDSERVTIFIITKLWKHHSYTITVTTRQTIDQALPILKIGPIGAITLNLLGDAAILVTIARALTIILIWLNGWLVHNYTRSCWSTKIRHAILSQTHCMERFTGSVCWAYSPRVGWQRPCHHLQLCRFLAPNVATNVQQTGEKL